MTISLKTKTGMNLLHTVTPGTTINKLKADIAARLGNIAPNRICLLNQEHPQLNTLSDTHTITELDI